MMHYAWLYLSVFVFFVWLVVYVFLPKKHSRKEMLVVSFWTALLGLTEPLFVPAYWNPPSLFDLAQRTGFDLESLLFAFAVGGIAVAAYETAFNPRHKKISRHERHQHWFHVWAVVSAPLVFILLLLTTNWNPIYSASFALLVGFFTTWYCRPDLVTKMFVSGLFFTAMYFISFFSLNMAFLGYTEAVWNLSALSGVLIIGVPLEELLWAFTFGLYWSSVYEHFGWDRTQT